MEAKPTTSSYGLADGERGAGGKLRKPTARKSQATPYDRPSFSQQGRGSWLSKLVDPAYRLVASGATKLFPSFFSTAAALPPPAENLDDKEESEITANAESNERCTPITERRRSDEPIDMGGNVPLSGIEQLIKGGSFTRDEVDRLVEMLKSRTDESAVEGNKKTDVLLTAGKSVEDMCPPVSKASDKGKQDLPNIAIRSPMPVPKIVPNEIGASPIEIARAYMGGFSEHGPGSSGVSSKGETAQQLAHEFASTPIIPSSAPRLSTTCWPGAMAQQHIYTTPNHRDRRKLHDFPQTPYSRSVFSKSTTGKTTQMQTHNKYISSTSNHFKQSQTPIFEQVKYRNDVVDNSYGSVGPIRRLRTKYASEVRPRESIFSKYSKDIPLGNGQPAVSHGKQFEAPRNLQLGETSTSRLQPELLEGSKVGNKPYINPAVDELVKRKVNQLNIHMATPQEKMNELKLARKSPTVASGATPKEKTSFSLSEKLNSHKRTDLFDPKLTSKGNSSGGNSNSQGDVQERNAVAREIVRASTEASSKDSGDYVKKSGVTTATSFSLKSPLFQPTSLKEKADQSIPPRNQGSEQLFTTTLDDSRFELLKKPPLHTPGTRPNLSHISVGRRDPVRSTSTDNGIGFTFPVSTSSSTLSEPPTPSVMPFSAGEVPSQPKELPTIPVYTFGSNKSTPRLAFSFPSTSSTPPREDDQDLKFEFGSDMKARVSFSSVGKDSICY